MDDHTAVEAMAVDGIADAETAAEATAQQSDNTALSTLVRVWIIPVIMTARYVYCTNQVCLTMHEENALPMREACSPSHPREC